MNVSRSIAMNRHNRAASIRVLHNHMTPALPHDRKTDLP